MPTDSRLVILRVEINRLVLENQPDPERRRYFFSHLYGVSKLCALIAIRRGLDPGLAAAAGMLHDIHPVMATDYDDHDIKGGPRAADILKQTGLYDDYEIEIISTAVSRHSGKEFVHSPYDEALKDADVLDHCLYDAVLPADDMQMKRYKNILDELGCFL